MYDAYFEERDLVPAGQLHELRFEDLQRDPIGELRKIYHALNLGPFDSAEGATWSYVDSLGGYRQNDYAQLRPDDQTRIAQAWRRSFDRWGYAA